mmetsp:Transcript_1943/g.6431  ORF Transcript_1943/g.6431 Transcript_1943/m.6431 type:complete len:237 (+) Transcript_1943:144-854(+)
MTSRGAPSAGGPGARGFAASLATILQRLSPEATSTCLAECACGRARTSWPGSTSMSPGFGKTSPQCQRAGAGRPPSRQRASCTSSAAAAATATTPAPWRGLTRRRGSGRQCRRCRSPVPASWRWWLAAQSTFSAVAGSGLRCSASSSRTRGTFSPPSCRCGARWVALRRPWARASTSSAAAPRTAVRAPAPTASIWTRRAGGGRTCPRRRPPTATSRRRLRWMVQSISLAVPRTGL